MRLFESPYLIYLVPLLLAVAVYLVRHRRREHLNVARLTEAREAGLTEPASLHPLIDPLRCLGSNACVRACPEGDVLGIIRGRAEIIDATHCIGHGACRAACPHGAITLVFGTAKRGVDIPLLSPTFETNVPGIYIAGELGGMGLIRNAVEQGRQAIDAIRRQKGANGQLDVVIVGAGPAGFAASLAAHAHKLRYATVEQESLGGCVFRYPRGKIVMTQPATLPLVGKVKMRETTKEALLGFWQDVEKRTGVRIRYNERMDDIVKTEKGFLVKTTKGSYEARAVLLAIGRRGTPRKLEVPGEELPKVVYSLIDPEQYRGQKVLVVGGGDAAIEAALAVAEQPGTAVALSYRGEAFDRAKPRNRERLESMSKAGRMRLLMKSKVRAISADRVQLDHDGKPVELGNHAVIVCAGGVLPTPFLKKIGITVETKYGTA
ncbi:4Fe-4S ferredoxin [Sulfurifustis variabilis]|uniref:4Fe-4S ferredoxin n=1 Tax=Sulfurifustis variabilis TaxID=1675686 RepID=A0A1B4VD91_9GAMM|nr:NAD(P)-binding domain-containing protein [Sulfurifustis variabilis]BAU50421.1 4Fe-4S ferredoxin [Sulfurifustis variabilis]